MFLRRKQRKVRTVPHISIPEDAVGSCNSKDGIPFRMTELFSGIGAQRMGAEREGIPVKVVATSEIDKYALRSYQAIYGDDPNLGNIAEIDTVPDSDILTYSFPCQDLSLSGKMRGMKEGSGTRSSLLWEVKRILLRKQAEGNLPAWLLMENVPAVLSKRNAEDFGEWIDFLRSLGYTSTWGTLNAKDFGVPQNRNRAFVLSHLGDYVPDLPVGGKQGTVLADVLEEDVPEKYYLSQARLKGLSESTEKERERGNGFAFKVKDRNEVAGTVTTHEGSRKTSNYVRDGSRCVQIGIADGINGHDILKRVYSEQALAPTVTTCAGGNLQPKISPDGERVRKLTPRECWRLQGFPDWAFDRARDVPTSDTQLYHQAGNSIAVPVLMSIFRTIDTADIEEKEGKRRGKGLDRWMR